jgi:hypothetical protein
MNTIKKSTEALLHVNQETGVEVQAEGTTCPFMSRHQSAEQKIAI